MQLLFVDLYKYSHRNRRRYLNRLYKKKLIYRTKAWNGYYYHIPDSVILDERQICIRQ